MSKHTPAPWVYQGGDNASVEVNIGETTANIDRADKNTGQYVISRDEMEANAKLISASPELLEACINALKDIKNINKDLISEGKHGYILMENELNNAIKKATL